MNYTRICAAPTHTRTADLRHSCVCHRGGEKEKKKTIYQCNLLSNIGNYEKCVPAKSFAVIRSYEISSMKLSAYRVPARNVRSANSLSHNCIVPSLAGCATHPCRLCDSQIVLYAQVELLLGEPPNSHFQTVHTICMHKIRLLTEDETSAVCASRDASRL